MKRPFTNRVQPGVPTGGQFAPTAHDESDVTLQISDQAATPADPERYGPNDSDPDVADAYDLLEDARSHQTLAERKTHDTAVYAIGQVAHRAYPGARSFTLAADTAERSTHVVSIVDRDGTEHLVDQEDPQLRDRLRDLDRYLTAQSANTEIQL